MTDVIARTQALRAAGIAGLIFSVLITISFVIFRAFPPDESGIPPEGRDPWLVGLYLIPFAGIAFLWFLATLRRRIGRLEDQFFATVFLGSGLLFVAMLFAASAAASSAVAMARFQAEGTLNQTAFEFGEALSETLFYVFAIKMAAAFMLVSSTIGRRTNAFPGWLVAAGAVAGIVMLFSVSFFQPLAVIFPLWVAAVSLLLLRVEPDTGSVD
jgi:hypothetical protein